MAAPNADFQFTEGHIRILLWMCDSHQDWVDTASAKIFENGETPSDNLMRCREGIADLKCWAYRLLEVIEATPDDEEDDDDEEDEFDVDDVDSQELADFVSHLEAGWSVHRRAGRRTTHPVQKLRRWILSLFG